MADNKTDWECVPCNWFLLAGGLEFQQKIGIQGEQPTCPECKRPLIPRKIVEES